MTESGDATTAARTRGRPITMVIAVVWVGLGFWAVEDGDMWRGAAGVALGLLFLSTWLWPESAFTRFAEASPFRRKK